MGLKNFVSKLLRRGDEKIPKEKRNGGAKNDKDIKKDAKDAKSTKKSKAKDPAAPTKTEASSRFTEAMRALPQRLTKFGKSSTTATSDHYKTAAMLVTPDYYKQLLQPHIPQLEQAPPSAVMSVVILCALLVLYLLKMIMSKIFRSSRRYNSADQKYYYLPPMSSASQDETLKALGVPISASFMMEQANALGPVFQLNVPSKDVPSATSGAVYVVGEASAAKQILQDPKTIKTVAAYKSLKTLASGHNVASDIGPLWKASHNGLSAAFKRKHMERLQKICQEQTEGWVEERLDRFAQAGQSFDLSQEIVYLTFSILCKSLFEYSVQPKESNLIIPEIGIATKTFGLEASLLSNSPSSFFARFFSEDKSLRAKQATQKLYKFGERILADYRSKTAQPTKQKRKESVIYCIAENKHYSSDKHRISDIVMVLLSGLESTAHSLSWIVYEMATNDDELLKLRGALQSDDAALAHDMLKDIVREGMRLHPVNSIIGIRTTGCDVFLKDVSEDGKQLVIPNGSTVIFPTSILTKHNIDKADQFLPSRWRDGESRDCLLFSIGRHSCIGQNIGLAEIAWVLSRLCSEYDFEIVRAPKGKKNHGMKCVGAQIKVLPVDLTIHRVSSNPQGGSS